MRTEPRLRRHKGRPVYRKVKSSIVYEMNHETTIGEALEFNPKRVKLAKVMNGSALGGIRAQHSFIMRRYLVELRNLKAAENGIDERVDIEIQYVEKWLSQAK